MHLPRRGRQRYHLAIAQESKEIQGQGHRNTQKEGATAPETTENGLKHKINHHVQNRSVVVVGRKEGGGRVETMEKPREKMDENQRAASARGDQAFTHH